MANKSRRKTKHSAGRFIPPVQSTKLTVADRDLLAIPHAEWTHARRKEQIVKQAIREGIDRASAQARCSCRTIRRLMSRYQMNPSLLAFLPRRPGPPIGSRHLEAAREAIVEDAVDKWMASRV